MAKPGKIQVGIVGLGTVGGGTLQLLQQNQALLKARTGLEFRVSRAADIDPARGAPFPAVKFTTAYADILNDPGIQIVVETVGGTGEPAFSVIRDSLAAGKHVVTANKALLAEKGEPLFKLAQEKGVGLYFEAAVCGGIPIIRSLQEGLLANRITKIIGILNGTCNYILTRMRTGRKTFGEALHDAQQAGFAEADPTLDISGMDTAHKLSLLCTLAWGIAVHPERIPRVGISEVNAEDIWFAQEIGYRIRLLALARRAGNSLSIQVHPTMVPQESMMGAVEEEFNAVAVLGDFCDSIFFSGKGAGSRPTASSVVADIVAAGRGLATAAPLRVYRPEEAEEISLTKNVTAAYYLRLKVLDRPGVLGKISTVLGQHQVSISRVVQHAITAAGEATVIIITHQCENRRLQRAGEEINGLDILKEKMITIQIEDAV